FFMFAAMLALVVGFWLHGEAFFDRTVARVMSDQACVKTRRVLVAARAGLQILPDRRLVAKVFVVSLVLWLLPILSSWLLIRGFGFDVPVSAAFVIFVCVGLGTAVPNPPGMIGVFQIASVAALGLYAIPQSQPVASGLVPNALQLLPPV